MEHTQTQAVVRRLSRAIGHLEAVRDMVAQGRDCCEVLTQLAAVRSALQGAAREVLKDHLRHCVVGAAQAGDLSALDALEGALDQCMK